MINTCLSLIVLKLSVILLISTWLNPRNSTSCRLGKSPYWSAPTSRQLSIRLKNCIMSIGHPLSNTWPESMTIRPVSRKGESSLESIFRKYTGAQDCNRNEIDCWNWWDRGKYLLTCSAGWDLLQLELPKRTCTWLPTTWTLIVTSTWSKMRTWTK